MWSRNRSFNLAGSLFVVFMFVHPLVSGNSCDNTGFHPEEKGQYLQHHVIDAMTTETVSLCRIMCYLQESCTSYNYQLSTGSCEISDSDNTIDGQLIPSSDHIYVKRENNPCDKSQCGHNQVCKPNFKDGRHNCLCRRGYKGLACNEDINECEIGKHDCPNGYKCKNTNGSFICKKKVHEEANISSGADDLDNSTILRDFGNSSYFEALKGFLAPVVKNSNASRWVRCWHAASDGLDVTKTFHPQCDGMGPTVTIVRVGKHVFGGYSDVSWHSGHYHKYFLTAESFLFSLFNIHGYEPIKLSLQEKISWITFGNRYKGPSFHFDLRIYPRFSWWRYKREMLRGYTRCGAYECPPGCSRYRYCSFFTKRYIFQINDVEVFFKN